MTESPCSGFLWSFLLLSIFSYLLAVPHIYSYLYKNLHLFFFFMTCFTFLFFPSWLPPHFAPHPVYLLPATAIIYLLSQSHVCFPARSLTHWVCLILYHSRIKSSSVHPPNKLWICLSVCLRALMWTVHMSMRAHVSLHYNAKIKNNNLVTQFVTHSQLSQYIRTQTLATGCVHHKWTMFTQRHYHSCPETSIIRSLSLHTQMCHTPQYFQYKRGLPWLGVCLNMKRVKQKVKATLSGLPIYSEC